jgi:DNA-binding SARP family transcriptional activator
VPLQGLDAGLPGRQGRLLFTYLVVNRHRHVPRDELAEARWREPDPAAVDARLNPLPSKLRRVFGAESPPSHQDRHRPDVRAIRRLGVRSL